MDFLLLSWLLPDLSHNCYWIGYSLLQIALKGNKIDETQMGINGRINDTLDFILDEVKASKRIINDESKIKFQNKNCTLLEEENFFLV